LRVEVGGGVRHVPLPPTLIRFAAQALKGRGRIFPPFPCRLACLL
jgi:hypothetical protein